MKYTRNGSRYTTEDGRYTIKKNYNTGAYTIYDFDKHELVKDKCRWVCSFIGSKMPRHLWKAFTHKMHSGRRYKEQNNEVYSNGVVGR